MARSEKFYVPELDYFKSGNQITGSMGEFNYRLWKEGERLSALTWYGKLCSEKSQPAAQADFAMDDSGLDQLVRWLEEQHRDE